LSSTVDGKLVFVQVIYDTLIEKSTPEEVEAVLGGSPVPVGRVDDSPLVDVDVLVLPSSSRTRSLAIR
jgi:hypothetical protein